MHPNLDPGLRAAVEREPPASANLSDATYEDLLELRARRAAGLAVAAQPVGEGVGEGVRVEDVVVPGPGGDLRLRVYRPAAQDGPLPGVYWIHGGGMVLGSPEADDARAGSYVRRVGCVVVSVDYRLAPEHPHPAPVEDCYAGLAWTAAHAGDLGVDAGRLAVGGVSAGGGLAAGTALLARDRGGPSLVFQLLLCPMLDDREITTSGRSFEDAVTWNRGSNRFGWAALLGDAAGGEDVPVHAAPARAADLSGLPPAYVDVGELEVFRDECADYALRLARAGVSVEFHLWPGAFHGFDTVVPRAALSRRARAERVSALTRALR